MLAFPPRRRRVPRMVVPYRKVTVPLGTPPVFAAISHAGGQGHRAVELRDLG